ncbi:MAG: PHP domain-containing protein [Kiritimatiellia bacterium]
MSIEFHCHTLFSVDGSGTPEALVDDAAARGVRCLSITEHNHLGSCERAAARAAEHGIRYFPGIELDAFFQQQSCHLLGLGIDPDHRALRELAERNYACYLHRFEIYFAVLREQGFPWTRADLEAYLAERYPTHPSPVLNHFCVPGFIATRGELDNFGAMRAKAVRALHERFTGPGPAIPGRFCRFEQARDAVHAAGGLLLLAHVGKYRPDNSEAQESMIRAVIRAGADGFELYHHSHQTHADLPGLAALARELDCAVSGGSDCHHTPGVPPKEIGGCGAPDALGEELAQRLAHGTG